MKKPLKELEKQIREQAVKDGITHLSTGIAIIKDGKVLIVRREPNDFLGGYYELPGGGIDKDETFYEAVKREVLEETGLEVTAITNILKGFDYTTNKKPRVRQTNFTVSVSPGEVQLSKEHDDYKWISPDEVDGFNMTKEIKTSIEDTFKDSL